MLGGWGSGRSALPAIFLSEGTGDVFEDNMGEGKLTKPLAPQQTTTGDWFCSDPKSSTPTRETKHMVTSDQTERFDYTYLPVNDLNVVTEEDEKTGKPVVKHVLVQDEPIQPTQRFWTSLFARYGFNKAFFKYFPYDEVFNRISEVESNDRMRLCIERGQGSKGPVNRLLAVSNPTKPLVVHDELMDMLTRYNGSGVNYSDGVVESTHTPRAGGTRFDVLGDLFENRFIMQTPIDGYGSPNLYLSLLRITCMNGMVGYSRAFRSSLALGKGADDVTPALTRALDGFNHDEGYAAIRQRIENAGKSWCSVLESQNLYKLLVKLHSDRSLDVNDTRLHKGTRIAELLTKDVKERRLGEESDTIGSPIIKAFHRMTGDPAESYGLANLDSLSSKRQRTLPVDCTVYDAINFATEVATHYAEPAGSRMLQAWVGGCISDEYDMEGTKDKFDEFADFLIDSKMSAGLTGSDRAAAASLN